MNQQIKHDIQIILIVMIVSSLTLLSTLSYAEALVNNTTSEIIEITDEAVIETNESEEEQETTENNIQILEEFLNNSTEEDVEETIEEEEEPNISTEKTTESIEEPEPIINEDEVIVKDSPRTLNFTDISHKSGLTAEEFDYILNKNIAQRFGYTNSVMLNNGEYLQYIEDTYDVNGLFAIAIASWETGHGRSSAAVNKNNLFGLSDATGTICKSFNSLFECYDYWGRLMRNHYFNKGYNTIDLVADKYCYGYQNEWVPMIYQFVDRYAQTAYNFINE